MIIVPYLSKNRVLLTALLSLSLIAASVYAVSKQTVYTAYTYFNSPETKIVLGDPQLYDGLDRGSFAVSETEKSSKIYKLECHSTESEEKAIFNLEQLLNNAYDWQSFVEVEPIRCMTTMPNHLKHFMTIWCALSFCAVGLVVVWAKRRELFWDPEPLDREEL